MTRSPIELFWTAKNMESEHLNISAGEVELVTAEKLWKDEDFCDVTLATSDGTQIKAHKVILASGSSLFRNILLQHKQPNPIVYLQGFESKHLQQIIELLYIGKCKIPSEDLSQFLKGGEALCIQSLAKYDDGKTVVHKIEKSSTEQILPLPTSQADLVSGIEQNNETTTMDQEQATYICDMCDNIAFNELDLEKHKETEHRNASDTCGECGFTISKSGGLSVKIHWEAVHQKEKALLQGVNFKCDQCEYIGEKKENLKRHQLSMHDRSVRRTCKLCDYKTELKSEMNIHEVFVHNGATYKCDQCEYVVTGEVDLKAHKTVHKAKTKKMMLYCTQCDYKTRQKRSKMIQHEESMHKGVTYKCDQCDYVGNNKPNLRRHKNNVHLNLTLKIKCNFCNFTSRRDHLNLHVRNVHQGVIESCDLCDRTFKHRTTLLMHKKRDHQSQKFYCNDCDFAATNYLGLSHHIERIHKAKEHKCLLCNFKTFLKSSLLKHTKLQHDERGHFKCEQCSYSSNQKVHLEIHIKSKHNGEKLECTVCNYKASQLSNLARHQRAKHKVVCAPISEQE